MAVTVPSGISPSRVESFTSCPMAFRFSSIDRIPEPPAPWSTKGTLVHRTLELLFAEPAPTRSVDLALTLLDKAATELQVTDEWMLLGLTGEAELAFLDEAEQLVRRYFQLEDPRRIEPLGLELRLEADLGGTNLRGIIDRLERDEHGGLVVTDYKTGKVPSVQYEQGKLGGVHFYAWLCEQALGERPVKVQLLYLSEPIAIIATPSEQSIRFLPKKVGAVWKAIERACEQDDFRPRPGRLCSYCSYQRWCPAFGGNPALAAVEAPILLRERLTGQEPLPLAPVPSAPAVEAPAQVAAPAGVVA
jgi:putative RecB family exonuclease